MTTLCIVDMQTEFAKPAKKCLNEVCRQIKLAKRRNAGIIILEYKHCGPTLPEIKSLLKSYKRKTYKQKTMNGGGTEVLAAARRKGFPTNKIRFVGVNRSYCVYETVSEYNYKNRFQGTPEIAIAATWCSASPRSGRAKLRTVGKFV
jgi:nicotinamidase-related amidase